MSERVLFTASTYSHIVNFHRPYLRAFSHLGFQVDVACGGMPMDIPEASEVIHVPFEKSMTSPRNLSAVRALRHTVEEKGYRLVSCHTSLASYFTRMALLGLRRRPKVACTVHGYLFDQDTGAAKRVLLSGAERMTAPVTDLLMTMNQWDYHYAQSHRLGRKVVNIPGMGVDFARLSQAGHEEGAALRRELGFGEEHFLVIFAAEFSHRKDQETLLRALALLPEQVGLLLPGSGALREECMMLAGELGVAHRVAFPGQVRDMGPWYAAADGAVSSSRSEGLPFNIMEAMYRGLPVAATRVKGHTDLIVEGETGLLYPFGDVQACAGQIRTLMETPDLARRLGAAAAQAVRRYELSRVLPQVMELYGELLPLPV